MGWNTVVENQNNFRIENNIFDCSARSLVCWFWDDGKLQNGLSVKNNIFYQTLNMRDVPDKVISGQTTNAVMSYGVKGNGFATLTADNQDEFMNGVIYFDNAPKEAVLVLDCEKLIQGNQ